MIFNLNVYLQINWYLELSGKSSNGSMDQDLKLDWSVFLVNWWDIKMLFYCSVPDHISPVIGVAFDQLGKTWISSLVRKVLFHNTYNPRENYLGNQRILQRRNRRIYERRNHRILQRSCQRIPGRIWWVKNSSVEVSKSLLTRSTSTSYRLPTGYM